MRARIVGAVALSTAVLLASGCTSSLGGTEGAVAAIVNEANANVVTRLVLTPEPDRLRVAVRVPGGEMWWTPAGQDAPVGADEMKPLGGDNPGAIDYEALDAQLESLANECADDPRVEAYVTASGAMLAESVCGTGASRTVVAATIDGVELMTGDVDFFTPEGLQQVFDEVAASLPGGVAYQVTLPGPKSARGYTAKAEGAQWVLPDGALCMVTIEISGNPEPGAGVRGFGCESYGPQETDLGVQEPMHSATLPTRRILQAMTDLAIANGLDPATIAFYRVHHPLIGGLRVGILTEDELFYEQDITVE